MLRDKIYILEKLIEQRGVKLDSYRSIQGLNPQVVNDFEDFLGLALPTDFKEFYNYKDGSGEINLIYKEVDGIKMSFRLYSQDEIIQELKCVEDMPMKGILSDEEIAKLDKRVKPYLNNRRWLPIGELIYSSHRLYLDCDPSKEGKQKQIIAYVHDPDFVYYLGDTLGELIDESIKNLEEVID